MAEGVLLGQGGGVQTINGQNPDLNGNIDINVETLDGVLPVEKGGTGGTTKAEAVRNIVDGSAIRPDSVKVSRDKFIPDYGIDASNSDIIGINGLFFEDSSQGGKEGLNFYRSSGHYDSVHASGGRLYFTPNRPQDSTGNPKEIYHSGNTVPVSNGGTGATSKADARKNIGISSGSSAPSGGSDGDIYIQWV